VMTGEPYIEPVSEIEQELANFESSIIKLDNVPDLESLVNEDGDLEYNAIRRAIGLPTHHYKTMEIVDRPLRILKMKKLQSDKRENQYYYLCLCEFVGETDRFTAPIGGAVAMPILDLYYKNPELPPLRVTLHYNHGGKYEGYYTLD